MSRNWSEQSEPKKQNAYGSCDWRKKQQTERKIHPAMFAMKRIMPSRNDVLIRGPEGDPRWARTNSQASTGIGLGGAPCSSLVSQRDRHRPGGPVMVAANHHLLRPLRHPLAQLFLRLLQAARRSIGG